MHFWGEKKHHSTVAKSREWKFKPGNSFVLAKNVMSTFLVTWKTLCRFVTLKKWSPTCQHLFPQSLTPTLSLLFAGNCTTMALHQSKDTLSMEQSWMPCKLRVAMETATLPPHPTPQKNHLEGSGFCWEIASHREALNPKLVSARLGNDIEKLDNANSTDYSKWVQL